MDKKYIIGFVIAIAVIIGVVAVISAQTAKTGPDLTAFAQCIKDKGSTFYGAFWCPHCQATKRMFGPAASLLPYIECSTPDGRGQLPICNEKGIKSYPTWFFPDGTTESGELTLEHLSEKTNCPLPSQVSSTQSPTTGSSTIVASSTRS